MRCVRTVRLEHEEKWSLLMASKTLSGVFLLCSIPGVTFIQLLRTLQTNTGSVHISSWLSLEINGTIISSRKHQICNILLLCWLQATGAQIMPCVIVNRKMCTSIGCTMSY